LKRPWLMVLVALLGYQCFPVNLNHQALMV